MASWKKPLGAAILVEALGLGGFFASALFRFSATQVVPALALKWEWAEALHDFMRWLPALQFLGLAVALGAPSGDSKGEEEALASQAVVPAVLLSVAFSALVLLGGPLVEGRRGSILASSAAFNRSLEAAKASLEAGDLARARAEFNVCAAVSPKDGRLEAVEERLENAELKALKAAKPEAAEAPAPAAADARTASEYYLKALAYFEKGDFFSAQWYAQTAVRIDPSYLDAKRLQAKAWEALSSRGGKEDPETAAFYSRKLEGYGLLRSGDPVGAYAVFKELAEKNPTDPDVKRYLAESLSEAEKASFFKDELEAAAAGGSLERAFLRVPAKGGPARILAAASASFAGDAAYFRELEYLEASPDGGAPLAWVSAPYAKLSGGRLFLLCVDRSKKGVNEVHKPSWKSGPASGPSSYIALDLQPEVAYRVMAARSRPAALDLVSAWRALSEAPAYGADPGPIGRDLVGRTGAPFALFASGILGALAGARFRRRGSGSRKDFPRGLYALVPFMAAAAFPAYVGAERVDALLADWASAAYPGFKALWVAAAVRAAILVAALVVVAGARTDRGGAEEQ